MCKINRFVFTILQFVLLVGSTKQSKIKQGINILKTIGNTIKKPISKTIGNTIKNSMGMLCQKTNNIKNVVSGLEKGGKQYLRSSNNVATKSVKYLREGALHKYKVPQGVRGGDKLLRTGSKKNTQMRSAEQMGEKGLKSLVNMVSKSKPQLPFMFATGGFMKLNEMNLVPENDVVEEIPVAEKIPVVEQIPYKKNLKFFDMSANLNDKQFKGMYHRKQFHEADLDHVMKRASTYGVDKFLLVGSYLENTEEIAKFCEGRSDCWTTVGVHPSRTNVIEDEGRKPEDYIAQMEKLIVKLDKKCSAIGECGLNYNRSRFSDKETQMKHFPLHFGLAEKFKLPMYLHSVNSEGDFTRMVKENRHRFSDGVVHSFIGNEEELNAIIDMGLYISINGCSLRTPEQLEIIKKIPIDRIMLETDSPFCEIRNLYASKEFVKTKIPYVGIKKDWNKDSMVWGRNEPCKIIQVAEAVAAIKGVSEEELASVVYENSSKIFARE